MAGKESPEAIRDQVIAEWVLLNGRLPGFEERLRASLPAWDTVEKGKTMKVWRAQGGTVTAAAEGTDPAKLQPGVRPVLATSTNPGSIRRYAGEKCCLFEITLNEGTRYIDVSKRITSAKESSTGPLSNESLGAIRTLCGEMEPRPSWPHPTTGLQYIRNALLQRCEGRITYKSNREVKEVIPPENEVMVYAVGGTFSPPAGDARFFDGRAVYSVTFTPSTKGGRRRGRTFRRKTLRRNKHGSRLARKSKHSVRNRHA